MHMQSVFIFDFPVKKKMKKGFVNFGRGGWKGTAGEEDIDK
jgi:hypothetical protein